MRNCIPDELFNRIEYPIGDETPVGLDGMFQEIVYKLPSATDVIVKKELWHSLCDFCYRTGALLEKFNGSVVDDEAGSEETEDAEDSATDVSVHINPTYGSFLRVVGVSKDGSRTSDFRIPDECFSDTNYRYVIVNGVTSSCYVLASVCPEFSDTSVTEGVWDPKIPQWFSNRYGECIVHGALVRLFAMTGRPWANPDLARMHAVAYNNDLTRLSFGLITSGMRKHLLIDVEDMLVSSNGNG